MPTCMVPPPIPRPPVVKWFKVYAVVFVVMYLAVAVGGVALFFVDPAMVNVYIGGDGVHTHSDTTSGASAGTDVESDFARIIMGVVFTIMGLGLAVASALPFFFSPRPWLWVYSLVLICLGLTSPCFLPFSIPLMIFWLKPETKAYYGKQ
jgi:hypothetical protein